MGGFIAERLADAELTLINFWHSPEFWWVVIGFVGQGLFMMRFIVQWIASEKANKSVIPDLFWFFSIGGGAVLLVYACYRKDPVFIFGQGLGLFIYFRNLYFVLRDRKARAAA